MTFRAVLLLFGGVRNPQLHQSTFRSIKKLPRLEDLPDAQLLPLIAIVGRPNVGKSALFNRLVRKRDALVFDTPDDHVTRDYREGLAHLGDLQFRIIDTSGLEPTAPPSSLQGRAASLTRGVLQSSHGVALMLDARQGVVPADEQLLQWLRRISLKVPLMILANKADTAAGRNNLDQIQADLAGLGLEPPTPISATSGDGLADLYQLLQPIVDKGLEESGPSGSSSSSMRHYVPAGYRFSAAAADPAATAGEILAAEQQQQQQQQGEGGNDMSNSSSDEGMVAAAAAAAAAEEMEVDRLLQQHRSTAAAAAAAAESGSDADVDFDPSTLSSSKAVDSDPEHQAAAAAAVDLDPEATSEQQQQQQLGPLRLAILGLPNAGKSTLMNTVLGYQRSLTGPEPGLTRDPTHGWLHHSGIDIQLIDTAGWKRATAPAPVQTPATKINPQPVDTSVSGSSSSSSVVSKVLADASLAQAKRALSGAHVVVLLLDAERLITVKQAITRLELQIASLALDHGKALLIALNKSDAVPGGPAAAAALRDEVAGILEGRFLAAGRLPVISLSALEGTGTDELMKGVVDAYTKWNKSVSSYKLRTTLAKHSLRFYGTGGSGQLLQRIKWAVQVKARPPTFALLLRGTDEVDESGQRFLANVLRQSLGLEGVPLRLYLRYNKRPKQQHQQGPNRARRRYANASARR